MILSDHYWLRTVTFALVVGGVLGGVNTAALLINGLPLDRALVGSIAFVGAVGLVLHAIMRYLLDQRLEPPEGDDDSEGEDTEATA